MRTRWVVKSSCWGVALSLSLSRDDDKFRLDQLAVDLVWEGGPKSVKCDWQLILEGSPRIFSVSISM